MKNYLLPCTSVNGRWAFHQKGFVLIAALIFLLVLSIFSIAMFRGFGLQDKVAGNIREKERAFHAAESNLEYAEWWLIQGSADTGSAWAERGSGVAPSTNSSPGPARYG